MRQKRVPFKFLKRQTDDTPTLNQFHDFPSEVIKMFGGSFCCWIEEENKINKVKGFMNRRNSQHGSFLQHSICVINMKTDNCGDEKILFTFFSCSTPNRFPFIFSPSFAPSQLDYETSWVDKLLSTHISLWQGRQRRRHDMTSDWFH